MRCNQSSSLQLLACQMHLLKAKKVNHNTPAAKNDSASQKIKIPV
jgi:hypothetical protein